VFFSHCSAGGKKTINRGEGMISRAEICKDTHTISSVFGESASTDYSDEVVEDGGRRSARRKDAGEGCFAFASFLSGDGRMRCRVDL